MEKQEAAASGAWRPFCSGAAAAGGPPASTRPSLPLRGVSGLRAPVSGVGGPGTGLDWAGIGLAAPLAAHPRAGPSRRVAGIPRTWRPSGCPQCGAPTELPGVGGRPLAARPLPA